MRTVWTFIKKLYTEINDDNVTDGAAMMAYYAAFAVFPMLVFVVTLTLLILPADTLHQGVEMATLAMPHAMGQMIAQQVDRMAEAASSGFAIGGAALALWGASRGAASLTTALNRMFQKKETRPWWKRQLIAIGITLAVAVLIVLALGLLIVGPTLGHYVVDRFGEGGLFDELWFWGRWIGAGLIVMFVWALLYKFLPDTEAPFRVFTPGAIAGVVLWLGVSYLFSLYLSYHDTYEATYGALGGAIVFLTWLWMSNLALLVGAEINDVVADMRKHEDPAAAQLAHKEAPKAANGKQDGPEKRGEAGDVHHDDDVDHLEEEIPMHVIANRPPRDGTADRRH
jgi:membrane protein